MKEKKILMIGTVLFIATGLLLFARGPVFAAEAQLVKIQPVG
jgi:hypothetical protein